MRLPTPLLAIGLIAACHAEKPDWAKQGEAKALPAAACQQVEKAVAQLKSSSIDVTDAGEATIPPPVWNGMSPTHHDQLIRTLAFHAACKAGSQSDAQPVVVHGDDGSELARRTVSTRADPGELLGD